MLTTLLIVLCALALLQVLRAGLYQVPWGVAPRRSLTILIAVLLLMAFAVGFVDA